MRACRLRGICGLHALCFCAVNSQPYVVSGAAGASGDSATAAWGFKATVVPTFPPNIHLTAPPLLRAAYDAAVLALTKGWCVVGV